MRRYEYLPICLAAPRSASSHEPLSGFSVGNAKNWGRDEVADAHFESKQDVEGLEYVEGLNCWVKTLNELLAEQQLDDHLDVFSHHSINLEGFLLMNEEDLLDIGIKDSVVKMLAATLQMGCGFHPVTKELIRPPKPSMDSAVRLGSKEECIFETEWISRSYICLELDKPHYSEFSFGMANQKT